MARDTRTRLLDTAERLFAAHGIAHVSDRRVAEEAGSTNHSAVGYHFGGRAGLLRALVDRNIGGLEPERRALFERSDSVLGDVYALVLPVTRALAQLPTPSWRARFWDHAMHEPSVRDVLREAVRESPTGQAVFGSVVARLEVPPSIAEGRARLMTHIITSTCAEVEERAERTGEPAPWDQIGGFLADALTGLLQAPVVAPPTGFEPALPP